MADASTPAVFLPLLTLPPELIAMIAEATVERSAQSLNPSVNFNYWDGAQKRSFVPTYNVSTTSKLSQTCTLLSDICAPALFRHAVIPLGLPLAYFVRALLRRRHLGAYVRSFAVKDWLATYTDPPVAAFRQEVESIVDHKEALMHYDALDLSPDHWVQLKEISHICSFLVTFALPFFPHITALAIDQWALELANYQRDRSDRFENLVQSSNTDAAFNAGVTSQTRAVAESPAQASASLDISHITLPASLRYLRLREWYSSSAATTLTQSLCACHQLTHLVVEMFPGYIEVLLSALLATPGLTQHLQVFELTSGHDQSLSDKTLKALAHFKQMRSLTLDFPECDLGDNDLVPSTTWPPQLSTVRLLLQSGDKSPIVIADAILTKKMPPTLEIITLSWYCFDYAQVDYDEHTHAQEMHKTLDFIDSIYDLESVCASHHIRLLHLELVPAVPIYNLTILVRDLLLAHDWTKITEENLTPDQRERLEAIFARTSLSYESLYLWSVDPEEVPLAF